MSNSSTVVAGDRDEFVRLQLKVDVVLDLPDDSDVVGPTGPDDRYFRFGATWLRYFFTGSYYVVRPYLRASCEPYADLTLELSDCVRGMTKVLAELQDMTADELAKTADGVFRARRRARQQVTSSSPEKSSRPTRRATSTRSRAVGGELVPTSEVHAAGGRSFAAELHAAHSEIETLRPTSGLPAADGSTTCHPERASSRAPLIAKAWAVFYVTGLAHLLGGSKGAAMTSIADPSIDRQQCLKGLGRVRDRLVPLDERERAQAFALIDEAFHKYVPEFDWTGRLSASGPAH